MPPRTGDDLSHYEDLCVAYRINFLGDVEPSQWPSCHRNTFAAAKLLGTRKYEAYATTPNTVESEPWKIEVKSLARLLVEKAGRHRSRNGSTWRYACEPIILGRLESEVCCTTCRKRLWRSEVEVSHEGSSAAAERLRARQRAREPCRCPRISRSQDQLEAFGLNPIFNFRADEEVHHSDDVTKRLGKGERPDRIYGLRQTRNIENLLYDGTKRQFQDASNIEKQVHEMLGNQPLRMTGDRILFPFLVLESKSGDSNYSWHRIHMQTAFSIKTFLDTQNSLRIATGIYSKWETGPLVWFLANRGEDWRLYASFMQPSPAKSHTIGNYEYQVINIWSGSIISTTGALQLLLLVDYIFDWARDSYREDILRELRVLANGSNDAASVIYTDPDIFSALAVDNVDKSWEPSEDLTNHQTFTSAQQNFAAMDSPSGVIRHASLVESKYCCVFVTVDNVSTLRRSIEQSKLVQLSKEVITHMKDGNLIELSTLDAIERQWTGRDRLSSRHLGETKIYTVMSFTTYISSSWQIIRELFAVAIAEEAWPEVVLASKLKPNMWKTRKPVIARELNEANALKRVKQLQAGSAFQVLDNAIHRRAVKLWGPAGERMPFTSDNGELRRVVNFVYLSFKKGSLEPQEPFLRCSGRLDQQWLLDCEVEPYFSFVSPVSKDNCVLVTATCYPEIDPERIKSKFCAFLTSREPHVPPREELHSIVLRAFETHDVYHTTRGHWSSALSPLKKMDTRGRNIWNLKDTYGVYSTGFEFLDLMHTLCPESDRVPITQGSSRDSDESGSQLYRRNFAPWRAPRSRIPDIRGRMFLLYKLFSREIRFWREVALERRSKGVSCCTVCAATTEDDTDTICEDCGTALLAPSLPTWFKRCMRGDEAFQIAPLEGPELYERMQRSGNTKWPLEEYIEDGRYDGPPDDDGDWAWNLDFYAKLEEPFHDIRELRSQWHAYEQFCKENRHYGLAHKRKRKHDETVDSDTEVQQDDSLYERVPSRENQDGPEEALNTSEHEL